MHNKLTNAITALLGGIALLTLVALSMKMAAYGDDKENFVVVATADNNIKSADNNSRSTENLEFINVHICGKVKNPGVYKIPKDSLAIDLIEAAGGVVEGGDANRLNLARKLRDGERIEIPVFSNAEKKNERVSDKKSEEAFLSGCEAKININGATEKDLDNIPGIGEKNAEKIFSYIREKGGIYSMDELENIPGIRKNIVEACRKYMIAE